MNKRIRSAAAAGFFLVGLVTLTSAFNSPNPSSRWAFLSAGVKPVQQRTTLTFGERVAYQRAIEGVYWRHRIWPKGRPDPKPSLDQAMTQAQLEKKVQDYLRDSQALEDYWQKPISAEQLQAEMERMAQHTKQPDVLRELFKALGNDPFVIVECLARPALSNRLVTSLHGAQIKPDALRARLTTVGSANYTLPTIADGANGCIDDTWTATANGPAGRAFHTAVWTGSEMIVWGGVGDSGDLNTGARYDPTTDSWTATSTTNAPSAREGPTGVWTGSEMIIWGGYDGVPTPFGGRYNPSTDSWTATSFTNVPSGRYFHTAVWSGSEMIVWGGYVGGGMDTDTGGRYNPRTDNWIATSRINDPRGREHHTAVWTGSEMIIWGGDGDDVSNTGGRYNPNTDTWTATSTFNTPSPRHAHSAVWTGSEMIIWGGSYNDAFNTGGRYDPNTDTWTLTSTINAPAARGDHTAIFTDSEMIVWGGVSDSGDSNTGGRYNPSTDSWTATSLTNVPSARLFHTAVWSGSEMIVWGGINSGFLNTGGRYCAQSQAPMAQSAFSRKTHGAAGTFDVPLPLTSNVGIECRSGGITNDYQMIINFATSVTVENASVTSGTGSVSSFNVSGSQVTVNLTGVTNAQRITVTLVNVNDGTHMANVPVSIGILTGDVNGSAAVNTVDVSQTQAHVGQVVSDSNFREDVNVNGTINVADVALVKAKVGTALPP